MQCTSEGLQLKIWQIFHNQYMWWKWVLWCFRDLFVKLFLAGPIDEVKRRYKVLEIHFWEAFFSDNNIGENSRECWLERGNLIYLVHSCHTLFPSYSSCERVSSVTAVNWDTNLYCSLDFFLKLSRIILSYISICHFFKILYILNIRTGKQGIVL